MSGAATRIPHCERCGKTTFELHFNALIDGYYCHPCDKYIRAPAPELEAAWHKRRAKQLQEAK